MADPITMMMAVSAGTALVGGGLQAAGTIAQGNAQLAAAKQEQANLNNMATEQMAVATRDASMKAREAKLLESRGLAVAASSGGGTGGSVIDIMGNIARDANVQERDLLRTGQEKANDLRYRGATGVATAKANQGISGILAGAQVASGVASAASTGASAYAKYGYGIPTGSIAPSQQTSSWYN